MGPLQQHAANFASVPMLLTTVSVAKWLNLRAGDIDCLPHGASAAESGRVLIHNFLSTAADAGSVTLLSSRRSRLNTNLLD